MAITPLGADEYGFIYNGESSKTYGVYITDGAFYSAPMRDTTRVEIPGRNGAFLQDHGRFKNIQVVYRCTLYTEAETDFISGIAAVRAWLCSVKGYARLTDDFNPNEYRMAAFVDGIEVSNIRPEVGTFDITFEAMPQRFLTSGETKTAVASGGTITNPTRFSSKPMLEVKGYGNMVVNGYPISLANQVLGSVKLTERGGANPQYTTPAYLASLVNSGNVITVKQGSEITLTLKMASNVTSLDIDLVTGGTFAHLTKSVNTNSATLRFSIDDLIFTAGTNATKTDAFSLEFFYRIGGGAEQSEYLTLTPTIQYNASTRTFTISLANSTWPSIVLQKSKICILEEATADSTVSALGNPTYIDCEIGDVYKIESGQLISLNNVANLGNELPELKPGANTITYDNTITELKVEPRWWTV